MQNKAINLNFRQNHHELPSFANQTSLISHITQQDSILP